MNTFCTPNEVNRLWNLDLRCVYKMGTICKSRLKLLPSPQGTILGPLLFLLYITDLPNCLSYSQPRMFANNTYLTFVDNDITKIERNLNDDLANICQWIIVNKLTLNMSKTEFMMIGSRQKLHTE